LQVNVGAEAGSPNIFMGFLGLSEAENALQNIKTDYIHCKLTYKILEIPKFCKHFQLCSAISNLTLFMNNLKSVNCTVKLKTTEIIYNSSYVANDFILFLWLCSAAPAMASSYHEVS
jgi:hypothetical protein